MNVLTRTIAGIFLGAVAATMPWSVAPARSADAEGNYAVRGAGSQSCAQFVEAIRANADDVAVYVEWIGGYLTALNRTTEATYDVSFIVSGEDAANIVARICTRTPDSLLETAVAQFAALSHEHRIVSQSPVQSARLGDAVALVRRDTLESFFERLVALGFADDTAAFEENGAEIIRSYQADKSLPQTGLPDFATLVNVFDERVRQ